MMDKFIYWYVLVQLFTFGLTVLIAGGYGLYRLARLTKYRMNNN